MEGFSDLYPQGSFRGQVWVVKCSSFVNDLMMLSLKICSNSTLILMLLLCLLKCHRCTYISLTPFDGICSVLCCAPLHFHECTIGRLLDGPATTLYNIVVNIQNWNFRSNIGHSCRLLLDEEAKEAEPNVVIHEAS